MDTRIREYDCSLLYTTKKAELSSAIFNQNKNVLIIQSNLGLKGTRHTYPGNQSLLCL